MDHLPELFCPVYQNAPYLAWHLGLSDFIIFLCYIAIPLLLFTPIVMLPRVATVLKIQGGLLALFILSCGITHLLKPILLFWDIWDVAVFANWLCALASVLATIHLAIYARPKLIGIAKALQDLMAAQGRVEIEKALAVLRDLLL
jgi:hypothetical protein